MSLSPAFLDELRARTVLSTLIGKTTKLTKAGREYKGCCPFHQEKTPSFYVNDDKGFYHCFGCSAHGDAIKWMTDQRGLPFIDAVKELAANAGMEVPAPDPRTAQRQERAKGLHEAMEDAQRWFETTLAGLDGTPARGLIERRGLRADTVKAFGLGFAPDSRTRLRSELKTYGDPLLIEAGLLISVEDKQPYDRFRGRLMIPIRDARGRVIAFGGRVIGDGEPKYLNSPDTPLFDKGRTLYNLDQALPAARKANRVIVVEGYMDVIALAQAGIGEAVAPLGTALTEAQLERLWRIADVPILCFDGDAAGQKAALRAAHRALPMLAPGRSLAFAILPTGQDPDDVLRNHGSATFETILSDTTTLSDLIWHSEVDDVAFSTPEEQAGLRVKLRTLAQSIKDADVREQYLATFNGLVWDLFNPDQPTSSFRRFSKHRAPAHHVSDRLVEISKRGIDQAVFVPALFKGFLRFPEMISRLAELFIKVPLHSRALRLTREAMLDEALRNRNLESDDVITILRDEGLEKVLKALDRVTIGFSFVTPGGNVERSRKDLAAVLDALVALPQIESDLMTARALLETEHTEGAFDILKRLLLTKAELDGSFRDALQAEHDAAFDMIEDN